jgi:uronate dehydrogenase
MVFASSNHVVGYHRAEREVGVDIPPRPDSRYAVSKVFGEALGRLYADKFGMSVVCLRIGSFRRVPETRRQLATWISPRDMVQLAICALEAPDIHFVVCYGVSANRRRRMMDDAAATIGFRPMDDAESYAAGLADEAGDPSSPAELFHGGPYCARDFNGEPSRIG